MDPVRVHQIAAAIVLISHAGEAAAHGTSLMSDASACIARGYRTLEALAPTVEEFRHFAEDAEEYALLFRAQEQAQRMAKRN